MESVKLCVCGRSKKFPVCDNRHVEEGWTCASGTQWVKFGFCASSPYQNIARKLAFHYQGVTCLEGDPLVHVETLVMIVDSCHLEFPIKMDQQIQANQRIVFSLGVAVNLLQSHFPNSLILDWSQENPLQLFKLITNVLDAPVPQFEKASLPSQPLQSAFISHAVKDEALILPAMDYLRNYFQSDFFTCADSIPPGTTWQPEILTALKEKDCFVLLLSQATLASHFCSFEIGAAYAWEKPLILISLDGVYPPVFIQHIQAIDLPRLKNQKPWLGLDDLLVDALLQALESN